jgi:hypothetical protein
MSTSAAVPTQLSFTSDEAHTTSNTESDSDNDINLPDRTHSDEEVEILMLEAASQIHNSKKGMLMKCSIDVILILLYIRQEAST